MGLPPRVYFTVHEVTARWGCNIADVAGWADAGRFRILTGIPAVRCGDDVVAGKVVLSPMELLPLFRRCGTGPTEGVMRRMTPSVGPVPQRRKSGSNSIGDNPTLPATTSSPQRTAGMPVRIRNRPVSAHPATSAMLQPQRAVTS